MEISIGEVDITTRSSGPQAIMDRPSAVASDSAREELPSGGSAMASGSAWEAGGWKSSWNSGSPWEEWPSGGSAMASGSAWWPSGGSAWQWDEWPSDAPNWQSGGVTWKSPRDAKPPIPTFPPPTALLQEAEPEWSDSSFASSAQGAVLPSEPEKPEHKAHRERTQKTHATRKVDARHEKPTWAAQRDETRRLGTTAKRPPVKELPRGMKLTLAHPKEKTCPRGPGAEALKRKAPEAAPAASAEGIPDPRGPAMVRLKREAPGAAPAASAPAAPAAAEDSIFKKEIAALGGIGMRGFQPPTFWDKQKTSEDKLPNFLLRPPMFARSNTIACRNHWCPFKAQVSNRGPKALCRHCKATVRSEKGKNVEIFMEAENEIWQASGEGCDYVSGWMPELENERFRLSTLQGRKSVASLAVIFWECDEISLPGDITTSRREFAV